MSKTTSRHVSLLLAFLLLLTPLAANAASYNGNPASSISSYSSSTPEDLHKSNLYAESAILIDARTGEVLYSKDPDLQRYPASITKLLTALVTVENTDPDTVVTVSDIINTVEPTIMGLVEGEEITVKDLLYGMLLKSANDAAAVLAVQVAGSIEDFAAKMNAKATELGCTSSNFIVPHGLPCENHYSTASDMAKIARAALQNETIKTIVGTYSYVVQPTNKTAETRTIKNTNALLPDSGSEYVYDGCIGMKTGFTNAAQHTFVGAALRDGLELISVTLGTTKEGKWLDAEKLLDYGFAKYSEVYLPDLWDSTQWTATVDNADGGYAAKSQSVTLQLPAEQEQDNLYMLLTKDEAELLKANPSAYIQLTLDPVQAPLSQGDKCGTIQVSIGEKTAQFTLCSTSDVAAFVEGDANNATPSPSAGIPTLTDISEYTEKHAYSWLWWLLLIPGILLLLFLFLVITASIRRRRRRARRLARGYRRVQKHDYPSGPRQ